MKLLLITLTLLITTLLASEPLPPPTLTPDGTVEWLDPSGELLASVTLVTNLTINWFPLPPIKSLPNQLLFVGFTATNLSVSIYQDGTTNLVFLRSLGQSKVPTHQKVELTP